MYQQPFTAQAALQFGFTRYGKYAGHCLLIMALIEGSCLLAAFGLARNITVCAQFLTQLDTAPPDMFVYSFIAVYLVVRTLAQVVVNRWLLVLYDDREMSIDELLGFDTVQHIAQMMRMTAASLVFTLYGLVGSLVLVVPGVVATSTLRFYRFLIVDKNSQAVDALRESYALSSGHKGALIRFNVLSTLIKLAGLLCFGIFYLPACVICGLAEAYAYKQLLASSAAAPESQPNRSAYVQEMRAAPGMSEQEQPVPDQQFVPRMQNQRDGMQQRQEAPALVNWFDQVEPEVPEPEPGTEEVARISYGFSPPLP